MSDYRLGIDQIRAFLPHRAPFLLVDRVLEINVKGDSNTMFGADKIGTRVVALKNVTYNEPFFTGHFPNLSIMPGVLVIECLAQASSFSVYPYFENRRDLMKNFGCMLIGVDQARFRRPVVPGDTMRLETEVTRCRGKLWGFKCSASVDGKVVAEAEILANLQMGSESADTGSSVS